MLIYVWDYDEFGDDDLMGMCVLPLDNAVVNDADFAKPVWVDLGMGKKGSELG